MSAKARVNCSGVGAMAESSPLQLVSYGYSAIAPFFVELLNFFIAYLFHLGIDLLFQEFFDRHSRALSLFFQESGLDNYPIHAG